MLMKFLFLRFFLSRLNTAPCLLPLTLFHIGIIAAYRDKNRAKKLNFTESGKQSTLKYIMYI